MIMRLVYIAYCVNIIQSCYRPIDIEHNNIIRQQFTYKTDKVKSDEICHLAYWRKTQQSNEKHYWQLPVTTTSQAEIIYRGLNL